MWARTTRSYPFPIILGSRCGFRGLKPWPSTPSAMGAPVGRAQAGVQFYPHHARDVPPSAPRRRLRLRLRCWARWHGELGPCRRWPSRTSSWWKRQGIAGGVAGEKCGGGGGKAHHTSTHKNGGECFSEVWRAAVGSRTKRSPKQPWRDST
jgi:hypothetical protein